MVHTLKFAKTVIIKLSCVLPLGSSSPVSNNKVQVPKINIMASSLTIHKTWEFNNRAFSQLPIPRYDDNEIAFETTVIQYQYMISTKLAVGNTNTLIQ